MADQRYKSFDQAGKAMGRNPGTDRNRPAQKGHHAPRALSNVGWRFYREYYYDLDFTAKDNDEDNAALLRGRNGVILDQGLAEIPPVECSHAITLKTTYPGLLTGTGITHETGRLGEIKLGFFFDHSFGAPLLPGSSVKGLLRSAFKHPAFIQALLGEQADSIDIDALELEIFEGGPKEQPKPIYQRDIFHDAIVIAPDEMGRVMGDDSITPHGDPLKNPIPILFIKVLPGVTFRFQFDLKDGLISAEAKADLFKALLLHLGIGAKTNVGYGKFVESTPQTAAS